MQLPDGPQDPAIIQTFWGIARPLERLEKAAQQYGDIFTIRTSAFPHQIIISNPQAIEEIFTADSKLLDSGSGNGILQPLVGDYSLLLHDGDYHYRQRRLLIPPFHGERMRAYGQLICDITKEVTSEWTVGTTVCARNYMQEISLRVILSAVFGIEEGSRYEQLRQLLSAMLDIFNVPLNAAFLFIRGLQKDLGAWSPWGRFLRQKQKVDEVLYAEIQQRREQGNFAGKDIFSLLMSARDENGQPMTDIELHDELMTLLFAGHETTATALAWALYKIHSVPGVQEKLLKELEGVGNNFEPSEIAQLPYLNAVCSETLRIHPVAMFTFARLVKSPIKLMGYEFEPGTILSPCIYLTHHRQDIYPEPKQFKPERFLERQFSPYEYLPFGGGNRRCIGVAFALYEMKLVLAKILLSYELELVNEHLVKPVRRGITLAPSGGVQMIVRDRCA